MRDLLAKANELWKRTGLPGRIRRWAEHPKRRARKRARFEAIAKMAKRRKRNSPAGSKKRKRWAARQERWEARAEELAPRAPERRVITRAEWGARSPRARYSLASTSNGVFIHHTVSATPTTVEAGKAEMRNLQRFHMDSRGWNDIAYSYLVDAAGNVYEGRGKGVVGGHTEGYNSTSHAICVMGNYETNHPTQAIIDAIRWVRHEVLGAENQPIRPHSAVNQTACPGVHLRSRLGGL